jgi:hypothetical protein
MAGKRGERGWLLPAICGKPCRRWFWRAFLLGNPPKIAENDLLNYFSNNPTLHSLVDYNMCAERVNLLTPKPVPASRSAEQF